MVVRKEKVLTIRNLRKMRDDLLLEVAEELKRKAVPGSPSYSEELHTYSNAIMDFYNKLIEFFFEDKIKRYNT